MKPYMQKLEFLWGLPLFYKETGEQKLKSFGSFLTEANPLFLSPKLAALLDEKSEKQDLPVIYRDENRVYFLCIKEGQIRYYTGPVCVEALERPRLLNYYREYGVPLDAEQHPVRMNLEKIMNFAGLLYELLTGKSVDGEKLLEENGLLNKSLRLMEKEETMLELQINEEEIYHHTYQEEKYVMDCIREGNVEEIEKRLEVLLGTAGILSNKEQNHQRNLAIVAVSIYTRAAIDGGVSPSRAYRLSDLFINRIDKCTSVEGLIEYNRSAALEFTRMVSENRSKKVASSYTEQCKDYIFHHYHQKIRLENVAYAMGISQGHLSRVFQKDTGMSIQEYIQRFRVERAANLLKYSEAGFTEISDYVGFYSQSHFGTVFKKYMGLSPKQYRDRYKEKEFCSEPGMEWKDAADEKRILPLP